MMMRDWKSFAGVVLIFLLGCLAGAFVAFAVVHHRTAVFMQRGSVAYEQLLERRLSRGLAMDADQRQRFHEAFAANIVERRKIQAQIQPQMQELNARTRQELRAILTPDQQERLRTNLADFRRRYGLPGLGRGALRNEVGSTNGLPESESNTAPDQL